MSSTTSEMRNMFEQQSFWRSLSLFDRVWAMWAEAWGGYWSWDPKET